MTEKHKHNWEVLSEEYYPFPSRIEYCSCGNKRIKKLTDQQAEELAERIGIITKEVITNVSGNRQHS